MSGNRKGAKNSKRHCTFNDQLRKDFPHIQATAIPGSVICTICHSTYKIGSGGRTAIEEHERTDKYKNALELRATSNPVTAYFRTAEPSDSDYELAAREGTFAFHTLTHNHSFRSMDCTSALLKKVADKKISCARTKCEAIIRNVFAPWAKEELLIELQDVEFISISIDVSNHKDTKLLPLLVTYFRVDSSNTDSLKTKLLDFVEILGETAEIIAEQVLQTLKQYQLQQKLVALSADNTNTNFGGLLRRGKVNVITKVKNDLQKDIIGLGCNAHIIHNGAQSALDSLPVDIEGIVLKVFRYFHIYTVRVERFKSFCDFVGQEYERVLGYSNVRWLSLLPALERILKLYEALKLFFLSENHCPAVLKTAFEDPVTEMWLTFAHSQMVLFHGSLLLVEGDRKSAIEACLTVKDLIRKLQVRKDEGFIPYMVRQQLRKLEENGLITKNSYQNVSNSFFDTAINYLSAWTQCTDDLQDLRCLLLRDAPNRNDFEKAVQTLKLKCSGIDINYDELFDEFTYLREFMTGKISSWKEESTEVQDKWHDVLLHFKDNFVPHNNLKKIAEFVMCLPGSNASVERVFSHMNFMWTPEKSQLTVDVLCAILTVKVNFNMPCEEFMKKITQQKSVLRKIHSSEKYGSQSQ